ncbi:Extracellular ligand-binding receptor [Leptothrix cholodnii SP-6]|uniref:Extracellular ligand-binding receptor n=1 Tax=Leptothrix cholodnii (strain ATCC 51168 / LMG 8142 / SP-6) TaxID=395495 RepID=B1Y7J5_LEPCP|nr:ABC transporter substrate-binding protein [Leptothrix cholodnii]ACB36143.1 Extracellular ligand-binding receptor [Leptothrix cholodnii SP-6]
MHAAMRMGAALMVALMAAALGFGPAAAADLGPDELAGRRIYLHGQSPSGASLSARIGMGGLELSGASIACGNCHGDDGRGRAEGGVVPSDIRWSELVKPYGHQHDSGRRHGPFDEAALRRAVLDGVDPDGNRLDGAMPRYAMSAKDLASLAAYLRQLETQLDPGLSADTIRIGTLLPLSGRMAGLGESLRALWTAYFARLNQQGGIHGRRLELVVEPLPEDPAQAGAQVRALVAERAVFALLAPVSAGVEQVLSAAASAAAVPVIGPLTLYPEDAQASNPQVFHLLPGVPELAQLLLQHAARELQLAQRPIALWHPDTAQGRATAQSLEVAARRAGWVKVVSGPFPARGAARDAAHDAVATTLRSRGVAAVLVLGAGADLASLTAAAERIGWAPQLLVPGPLASRDILGLPASFRDHVTLAYPSAPAQQQAGAMREFMRLLEAAPALPGGPGRSDARAYQPTLVSAYAAGLLLVEGLKRSGRELSRRKLLATLESVQSFDTGLLPPLSFNADRRIGAAGGYLVGVDLDAHSLRPLGGYRLP